MVKTASERQRRGGNVSGRVEASKSSLHWTEKPTNSFNIFVVANSKRKVSAFRH